MTITERRILLTTDIRAVCVREGWYTNGTNEEYGTMIGIASQIDNMTKEDLYDLAKDIYDHSAARAFTGMSKNEAIANVMFILGFKSVTMFEIHY